jgi:hypothetical protein
MKGDESGKKNKGIYKSLGGNSVKLTRKGRTLDGGLKKWTLKS